ncbi:uncharacterized protein BDR25DRAFT_308370 [Lindgomyces ingoldianus]|uniref:Uncharacterized protein n=1 Tax=Lindgomyces ingoldianus TaxID=673940 RepID=A0ACB6RGJ7_9PLEO|nr:uncharacterized protein BDR25DRAFT_308370 [Lindgomyces ingoldianus]KAF2477442.1 hypothetical protein BDR25DRAFT_308370 [Lindgomyces ingoldianus]
MSDTYGSGTVGGVGFGNKMSADPDPNHPELSEQHTTTRFGRNDFHAYSGGHETYGSGAVGGAGFGNKTAPESEDYDNSNIRFGSHGETKPYSGHTEHGSGTTGGAGYGNKTGVFKTRNDSTLGKLMEKVGHVTHNENLAEKGRAKREVQGFGQSEEM